VVVFAGGIKALGGLRSPSGERSVWAGVGWTCGPVLGCDGQPQSADGISRVRPWGAAAYGRSTVWWITSRYGSAWAGTIRFLHD